MKKLLLISFSSLLFLSACGSDETKETSDSSNGGAAASDSTEVKKDLMIIHLVEWLYVKFYMSVPNTINAVDGGLNTFEQQQAEGLLPEGDDLASLKESAGTSAEEASKAVAAIEIPETLSSKEEELQKALSLISESYDLKVAALAEDDTTFETANGKFIEADEIFNAVLEENELIPSSIFNEVQ